MQCKKTEQKESISKESSAQYSLKMPKYFYKERKKKRGRKEGIGCCLF
jgi:hypothetical protein